MKEFLSRRSFLSHLLKIGAVGAVLQGTNQFGITAKRVRAAKHNGTSPHQWVMLIDLDKCTGCNFCSHACKAVNDTAEGIEWNTVFVDDDTFSNTVYIPRPCMHCENAPCVNVCPVGATYHRDDGLIVTDYDKCIGCRYCQAACPYGGRYFNWQENQSLNPMVPEWGIPEIERRPRGVSEKCTFCVQRIDVGLSRGKMPGRDQDATPACVNICPVGARIFGDINDLDSNVSILLNTREHIRLREYLGVNPRVYYLLPERRA